MKKQAVTIEQILWLIILVIACGLRFINLGSQPLSDGEAHWALQALDVFPKSANLEISSPGSQTGYISITGLLFWLLGSSDAAARTLSALTGVLLCLFPLFLRNWIGRPAALIMAAGLALDPGLVSVLRLAGGPMPALSFFLLGLGLLAAGRVILSGVVLGLALLSGPSFWYGLLISVVSAGFVTLAGRAGWIAPFGDPEQEREGIFPPLSGWKYGLLSAGLTVLLVGALFGLFPAGLGAAGASLPDYLTGWAAYSGVSAAQLLAVCFAYLPLALVFGFIAAVRGWVSGSAIAQRMGIWAVTALLLVLLYPGRQVADLVWVLAPVWGLASMELARYLDIEDRYKVLVFGQAALVFSMLSLMWLTLAGFNQPAVDQRAYLLRIGILLGVLFLLGLVTALLGYGWKWKTAVQGLVWGLTAAFVVYQIAGIWTASRPVTAQMLDIWQPSPQAAENLLLIKTVEELSERNTGMPEQIDVTVSVDSPSLRWSLRNFPNATFVPEQGASTLRDSPSLIITRLEEQNPVLAASYRGQDIPWWRLPGWNGALPQPLPNWIAYRKNPALMTPVILWARSDLFVDTSTAAGEGSPPEDLEAPLEEEIP